MSAISRSFCGRPLSQPQAFLSVHSLGDENLLYCCSLFSFLSPSRGTLIPVTYLLHSSLGRLTTKIVSRCKVCTWLGTLKVSSKLVYVYYRLKHESTTLCWCCTGSLHWHSGNRCTSGSLKVTATHEEGNLQKEWIRRASGYLKLGLSAQLWCQWWRLLGRKYHIRQSRMLLRHLSTGLLKDALAFRWDNDVLFLTITPDSILEFLSFWPWGIRPAHNSLVEQGGPSPVVHKADGNVESDCHAPVLQPGNSAQRKQRLPRNPEQSCATRFGTPSEWGLHHPQKPAAPLNSLISGFFNLLHKVLPWEYSPWWQEHSRIKCNGKYKEQRWFWKQMSLLQRAVVKREGQGTTRGKPRHFLHNSHTLVPLKGLPPSIRQPLIGIN